jgi:hypothetical protein
VVRELAPLVTAVRFGLWVGQTVFDLARSRLKRRRELFARPLIDIPLFLDPNLASEICEPLNGPIYGGSATACSSLYPGMPSSSLALRFRRMARRWRPQMEGGL